MSLQSIFTDLSVHLQSSEFRDRACHADHANAFIRHRKLPLPSLVAVMLSGMRKSCRPNSTRYPAAAFGDLYHQRWRIEEAFKRLKHKLNLEHISGLSQLAVMQDFATKVLWDNLQSIVTLTAHAAANLATERR